MFDLEREIALAPSPCLSLCPSPFPSLCLSGLVDHCSNRVSPSASCRLKTAEEPLQQDDPLRGLGAGWSTETAHQEDNDDVLRHGKLGKKKKKVK